MKLVTACITIALLASCLPEREQVIRWTLQSHATESSLDWWSGKDPAWALMNSGPFDFTNLDACMIFLSSGEGTQLANEMSNKDGILWRAAERGSYRSFPRT